MPPYRALLILAWALFVATVLGVLAAFGTFLWYDTGFWESFEPVPVLRVGAALSASLAVSSGALFYHYRYQESYSSFAEVVFAFLLFVSAVNFLWMAPVLLFV